MQKTYLVMRQEILKMLRSTGYVIFAFILPGAAVVVMVFINFIQSNSTETVQPDTVAPQTEFQIAKEGFVDKSNLIQELPAEFEGYLFAYETEEQAIQAMRDGRISTYYVVPNDYLEVGEIYNVYPDTRSYLSDGQGWVMSKTLMFNLLERDPNTLDWVWNPVRYFNTHNITVESLTGDTQMDNCSRPGASCGSNDLIRYMPSIMAALFFTTFMSSSSMLFNSIGTEKENRVMEVLLLSVSPKELLTGKTLGLGITGLLQSAIWLTAFYVSFNLGGSLLKLPENFIFPIDLLIWGLLFFMGGYGLYANLMAGAGALIPRMKEAGLAQYIAMAPLFIGYLFGLMAPLADAAESKFIEFLSIFPLTSPVVMIMRLTNSIIPFWQPLLAIILLFISAYYSLRMVAIMFHTQNLLSGQPFSLKRYLNALVGR
ncbi:ABC transporter permease [Chloroflexota bacterium]